MGLRTSGSGLKGLRNKWFKSFKAFMLPASIRDASVCSSGGGGPPMYPLYTLFGSSLIPTVLGARSGETLLRGSLH